MSPVTDSKTSHYTFIFAFMCNLF